MGQTETPEVVPVTREFLTELIEQTISARRKTESLLAIVKVAFAIGLGVAVMTGVLVFQLLRSMERTESQVTELRQLAGQLDEGNKKAQAELGELRKGTSEQNQKMVEIQKDLKTVGDTVKRL